MALRTQNPEDVWVYLVRGSGGEKEKRHLPVGLADRICVECRTLIPDNNQDCCWPCTWDLTESQEHEYAQMQHAFEKRVLAEADTPAPAPAPPAFPAGGAGAGGGGGHPLIVPIVDAIRGLAAWEKPDPGSGMLIPELQELLPGIREAASELWATLSVVVEKLTDSPVSPATVAVLDQIATITLWASVDLENALQQWQIDDAADIARHDAPRIEEADYNVGQADAYNPGDPIAVLLADTAPAVVKPPPPEPGCRVDLGDIKGDQHLYDPAPSWRQGASDHRSCGQPRNADCHKIDAWQRRDQDFMAATGVVACQAPGCDVVCTRNITLPTTNADDVIKAANEQTLTDAMAGGWFVYHNDPWDPPEYIGCPDHPGRTFEVQVVCEWNNGDNYCYASHIGVYGGKDKQWATARAHAELQTRRWNIQPDFVGCPTHPTQYRPIPPEVLAAHGRKLARQLENSEEAGRYRLSGGCMGDVFRVRLADGSTVVEKRIRVGNIPGRPAVDQQDAEELGSAVLRALGLNAPDVVRTAPDTVILTDMPGTPAGTTWPTPAEVLQEADRIAGSDLGRIIGVGQILIDNTDLHVLNWLVHRPADGGEPVVSVLDLGLAFDRVDIFLDGGRPAQFNREQFTANYVDPRPVRGSGESARWTANPLHPDDAAEIKRRVETTRPEFERLNRMGWYEFMLQRADAIAANACGIERIPTWPTPTSVQPTR